MTKSKPAADRRKEFMDAAEALFNEKGYENTSIDDIVQRVGVAKGLFYYYFKSREELLTDIVNRLLDEMQETLIRDTSEPGLTSMQRLVAMFTSGSEIRERSARIMMYFHEERNQALHLQVEARSMKFLIPVMESIIVQGNDEGIFHAKYPRETAQALFAASGTIAHEFAGIDYPEDWERLGRILSYITERLLDTDEGIFDAVLREIWCHKEKMRMINAKNGSN